MSDNLKSQDSQNLKYILHHIPLPKTWSDLKLQIFQTCVLIYSTSSYTAPISPIFSSKFVLSLSYQSTFQVYYLPFSLSTKPCYLHKKFRFFGNFNVVFCFFLSYNVDCLTFAPIYINERNIFLQIVYDMEKLNQKTFLSYIFWERI